MADPSPQAAQAAQVSPVLKWAVIIMGVLLVVGFVVVISTIILRAVKLGEADGAGEGTSGAGFAAHEVAVPAGARIERVVLDGRRMALHLRGPGGEEIVLIDTRSGRVIGRVRLTPGE